MERVGKGKLGGNKDALGDSGQTQAWLRAASSESGQGSRNLGWRGRTGQAET